MGKFKEYKYLLPLMTDRSLHGAFSRDDTIRFEVCGKAESVVMEIHRDAENDICIVFSNDGNGVFSRDISMKMLCHDTDDGLFWYRYRISASDGTTDAFGGESPRELIPCSEGGDRQLLVYRNDLSVPEKLMGCVIYHIFTDRFKKSGNYPLRADAVPVEWGSDVPEFGESPGDPVKNNTFYGGDLDGITEKLPYISSLGTEMIYLSPVFTSPSNHRYDTADYMRTDPMLGGDAALERLCNEAEKYGISVILDGVFNHTGADSVYFNKFSKYDSAGAYESKASPYFSWYNFKSFPDCYECWWGVDIMPRVDSNNPSWQEFIMGEDGVISKYMKMGVKGWRLDVCDELTDGFLDNFRKSAKAKYPDTAIIGEVWEDASSKISYGSRRRYLRGGQLDSVMNYPFREAVLEYVRHGDHAKFKSITEGIFRRYPEDIMHCTMNMLGTHDTVRAITALAGESGDGIPGNRLKDMRLSENDHTKGKRMAAFAFGIMCALPGAVSIYYGDETGMEGYRDPFCRRPYPWGDEDTDMIAGFSALGQLKKGCDVLRRGEFEIADITSDYLEIHRYISEKRMICRFCRTGSAKTDIPEGYNILLGDNDSSTEWSMIFMGNF
ncbi:MAG: glycoside hydrolase family 13 protein [Ruminococcaceae bacterium]|nr:glycoside hydrolase family 13 protein [Oscillospiraceae bacterium]